MVDYRQMERDRLFFQRRRQGRREQSERLWQERGREQNKAAISVAVLWGKQRERWQRLRLELTDQWSDQLWICIPVLLSSFAPWQLEKVRLEMRGALRPHALKHPKYSHRLFCSVFEFLSFYVIFFFPAANWALSHFCTFLIALAIEEGVSGCFCSSVAL